MHTQIFDPATQSVFESLKGQEFLEPFYLAGGTALALHFGHRKSIDLDFFSAEKFNTSALRQKLSSLGEYQLELQDPDTLDGLLNGVKVSFFHYSYPQLFPLKHLDGIQLADERDIAAMKLDAISSRGSRKDFIDLFFLMKKYSLSELLLFFENKFSQFKYNKAHLIKSLTYFDQAEMEAMPIMLNEASWPEMKRVIASEAGKLLR